MAAAEEDDDTVIPQMDDVCGSEEIAQMVEGDSIPWGRVDAYVEAFISGTEERMAEIKKALAKLETDLKEATTEAPLTTPKDPTVRMKLITDGLFDAGKQVFTDAAEAQETKCGDDKTAIMEMMDTLEEEGKDVREFRKRIYQAKPNAKKKFSDLLKAADPNILIGADEIRKECKDMLGVKDGDTMNCGGLCNDIADQTDTVDAAKKPSGDGAKKKVKLQSEIKALKDEYKGKDSDLTDCKQQQKKLNDFKKVEDVLRSNSATASGQFEVAKASYDELTGWIEHCQKTEVRRKAKFDTETETLLKLLKESESLQGKLDEVTQTRTEASEKLEQLQADIEAAREAIDGDNAALDGMGQLQLHLVQLVKHTVNYYDKRVRQPVRDLTMLGASKFENEDGVIEGVFTRKAQHGAKFIDETKKDVAELEKTCKGAEKELKDHGLASLCEFTKADSEAAISGFAAEVVANTDKKVTKVQGYLNDLLEELREYKKGKKAAARASSETEEAQRQAGQLEGLTKAKPIIGPTAFFKNYLTHWEVPQKEAMRELQAKNPKEVPVEDTSAPAEDDPFGSMSAGAFDGEDDEEQGKGKLVELTQGKEKELNDDIAKKEESITDLGVKKEKTIEKINEFTQKMKELEAELTQKLAEYEGQEKVVAKIEGLLKKVRGEIEEEQSKVEGITAAMAAAEQASNKAKAEWARAHAAGQSLMQDAMALLQHFSQTTQDAETTYFATEAKGRFIKMH
eukprot:gnl/TRDRNA2_/TRDRNA2_37315_c0_seq1.p1 gnl/TRDRNA2_/TRDRNA2_37315_c0~~gnl/TRDRNA2_/TRDRNA2_37315_c0_seq1.p1  ORF type:complete len:861 (+),score=260.27 gnl/TRDRNA2_/TRDRNA2_37315_c0_seq1:368-2584(+)